MTQRDDRVLMEDELYKLWSLVPLTPLALEQNAPTLCRYLSPSGSGIDTYIALTMLLEDAVLLEQSREAVSVAAALGIGVRDKSPTIDHRLVQAAAKFEKDSARTGRRWAKRGVEWLVEQILKVDRNRPTLNIGITQAPDRTVTASVDYDQGGSEHPLSQLYVQVNDEDTSAALAFEWDEDFGESLEVDDLLLPFDSEGQATIKVSWVGFWSPDLIITSVMQAGYAAVSFVDLRSVVVAVGENPASEA